MFSRRHLLTLLVMGVISGSSFSSDASAAEREMRILFVTQSVGYKHGSVTRKSGLSPAEIALTQLGEKTGLFTVHCTQDCAADFTKENLQNYDIVAFYTTGNLPIADADKDYFFKEWLPQKGHGVLGFHSALDTFHDYEPYWDMIGGTFISHPWTSKTHVTITNLEPKNPLTRAFGKELKLQEEIYMYRHWQPEKVHLLMSLDYANSPVSNPVITQYGYHVPVCWIKEYGQGRVYVNNLGHNETTWTNAAFLDSITAAVKWIRGDLNVDATPNPGVSAAQEKKAQADFAQGNFKVKEPAPEKK